MKKALAVLVTVILALCLFVSCEEGSSTPAEYTLTFKTSGSQYEKTVTGGAYTLPNATSVTRGLSPVFRGWQIEGDTKIMEAGDIITVSSDMTLTARYKDDCKVTVKDGESVVAEDHLIYGERYTLPSALEKKGFNFLGWKVGEETLAAGEKITVTADTTVTASWTEAYTCLVDYNYQECREVYVVENGTEVNLSTDWDITKLAEKYGKKFLGWYLNGKEYLKSEDSSSDWKKTVTITSDSVMTAIWAENINSENKATYHTVTFTNYYGTGSNLEVKILDNNTVYLPDEMNPEQDGHTFLGWYNGETKFDFNTKITADTTLKAKFDPNFTVTFYSDNGTPWGVSTQTVTTTSGATITGIKDSEPKKEGCEFAGWYNGDEKFEFGKTTVKANVTYTAKWYCRVKFVINNSGSSDKYDDQMVFVGSTATAPQPNPTTTERHTKFVYWSLTPNGTKYDFSTPLTKSITLYAVWRLSGNGKIVV